MVIILEAVIDYVRQQEGTIIEGYPIEPKKKNYPPVFACTGFASSFLKAGFKECLRRSETRPIMRFTIK